MSTNRRAAVSAGQPIPLLDQDTAIRSAAPPIALRDYQEAALRHLRRAVRAGPGPYYFTLPTGCGKTVILAALAAELTARGRVLVLAHRRELIGQLAAAMGAAVGEGAVGIVGLGREQADRPVVVATVQALGRPATVARCIAAGGPIVACLIDEAHHVTAANTYGRLVAALTSAFPGCVVVGCTATPYRADAASMQRVLPRCVFDRTVSDMQAGGWLTPLRWERCAIPGLELAAVASRARAGERDYAPDELAVILDHPDVTEAIAAATAPRLAGAPACVFAVSVAHAHHLAAAYRGHGIAAAVVWGAMPSADRAATLAAWRSGSIEVVVNVAVLTEGFDFPALGRLVIARPTRSPGLYVQMLGRALRPAPGKPSALVIDVVGNANAADPAQVTFGALVGREADDAPAAAGAGAPGAPTAPRRWWLLDPVGHSPHAWVETPGGLYALGLGNGWLACLRPDPEGSGLWRPELCRADQHRPLSSGWVPLGEAVGHAGYAIGRAGAPVLVARGRSWRTTPASIAQLDYLGVLDPEAAARARREGWDRGALAAAITAALADGWLGRPRRLEPPRPAVGRPLFAARGQG